MENTTTIPKGRYRVQVADSDIVRTPSGEVGLIWVMTVYKPVKHNGANLVKRTPFNPDDTESFKAAARELHIAGLTTKQMWSGDVHKLLRGVRLEIDYTPEDEAQGLAETIEILRKVGYR